MIKRFLARRRLKRLNKVSKWLEDELDWAHDRMRDLHRRNLAVVNDPIVQRSQIMIMALRYEKESLCAKLGLQTRRVLCKST